MAREFKLPDIGEGVHEGEIVKWFVKEGQPIKENDLMVEVMTDKVTVQIPSPVTGKVLQIRAKDGEVVKVGQTIIVLGDEGETAPAPSVEAAPRPSARAPPPPAPRATPWPPPPTAAPVGPALATPAVRKLAREVGVNIDLIRGTGPGGRVTEEDVRAASRGAPAIKPAVAVPELAPTQPVGPEERIPIHGLRRRIAEKMAKSKATASHFTYVEEVDMTQLVHLRDRLKEAGEQKGVKLTYLPFIVKAVVAALKEHPTLNASMDDAKQEIVIKRYYNIGLATATEEGLTVTVVHEADKRDIWALAQEIERLGNAAREKKLTLHDIQGSTFTITSLGKAGGIVATPIINWPEVAIIGIHKIEKRPIVRNDQIVIREMMYLSCSFDHRVIDGHIGAAFVQSLSNYLEHPALLFVGMA
ncbi:MAG TPA: dihydrolipoamide acetyltransferase family protein [Thermoplasmata archaeon]|nr:dihydrolipoamide acetyltransferase family protein [Thermoplasmata archaeon]